MDAPVFLDVCLAEHKLAEDKTQSRGSRNRKFGGKKSIKIPNSSKKEIQSLSSLFLREGFTQVEMLGFVLNTTDNR